ncbi:abscission/NoCut checkpoint regulator-like [Acanthaster planci]|uniref:Abscission/NoCut checkpoint regulator-like n=1 Tax=Acanthaster planci TaxID=133434 RepID=A0A8B7YBC2_ACAPL|nr:abscission/NoCut checkpoint regulator-like [Acanthaster planci]
MDGKCFSCTEKFGIFRREHGCKSCGFAFCSKCLDHSIVVPGKGPKEQSVCSKCYKRLTVPPSNEPEEGEKWTLPENFKKRIAALASKQNEESSGSSSSSSKKKVLTSARSEDRDIAERLERLKDARRKMRGRTLSTEEIEDRLKKLKGEPTSSEASGSPAAAPHQPPDQRTPHEQTQDLLAQMKEEAAIDAKMDGSEINVMIQSCVNTACENVTLSHDIQITKLQRGRVNSQTAIGQLTTTCHTMDHDFESTEGGRGPSSGEKMEVDEEQDEEEASNRLIKQLLEQDKLEATTGALGYASQDSQPQSTATSTQKSFHGGSAPDPDELPWCCICNEDATLRCHGCDDDLYCKRCFREGHDGFDLKDHQTSSYRPPRPGKR